MTRSVGSLKKIVLGHVSKQDDPPRTREEQNGRWICDRVVVKDTSTGTEYLFPVNDALGLDKEPKLYRCENKRESLAAKTKTLKNVNYEVLVCTGKEKDAGTRKSFLQRLWPLYL